MHRVGILRRISAAFALVLLLFSTHADVYAKSHCAHHGLPSAHHHGHAEHNGPCTCLGDCAGAPGAILAPHVDIQFEAAVVDVDAAIPAAHSLISTPKYLLPFSTAPPLSWF